MRRLLFGNAFKSLRTTGVGGAGRGKIRALSDVGLFKHTAANFQEISAWSTAAA
jgi:hypothetical protein